MHCTRTATQTYTRITKQSTANLLYVMPECRSPMQTIFTDGNDFEHVRRPREGAPELHQFGGVPLG